MNIDKESLQIAKLLKTKRDPKLLFDFVMKYGDSMTGDIEEEIDKVPKTFASQCKFLISIRPYIGITKIFHSLTEILLEDINISVRNDLELILRALVYPLYCAIHKKECKSKLFPDEYTSESFVCSLDMLPNEEFIENISTTYTGDWQTRGASNLFIIGMKSNQNEIISILKSLLFIEEGKAIEYVNEIIDKGFLKLRFAYPRECFDLIYALKEHCICIHFVYDSGYIRFTSLEEGEGIYD